MNVMPRGEAMQSALSFNNDQHGRAEAVLHFSVFNGRQRLLRAVIALFLCWLAALLSLPIVGAHWLLVPGFLIYGVVLFVKNLRSERLVRSVAGRCPVHGGDVNVKLNGDQWPPLWLYCPQCRGSLHVVDDSGATGAE